jgi:hypothetical protein
MKRMNLEPCFSKPPLSYPGHMGPSEGAPGWRYHSGASHPKLIRKAHSQDASQIPKSKSLGVRPSDLFYPLSRDFWCMQMFKKHWFRWGNNINIKWATCLPFWGIAAPSDSVYWVCCLLGPTLNAFPTLCPLFLTKPYVVGCAISHKT